MKGQVSIFVVVAILIVVGAVAFLVFRDSFGEDVPREFAPVFEFYQSCIEQETKLAVQISGSQGGRIDVGEYIPGSEYAPFSSHLNFLGTPIGYWSYVSANGVIKENVPSMSDIEREIEEFIAEGLGECDFERFYQQEFDVELGDISVNVDVKKSNVEVIVDSALSVSKGNESASKGNYNSRIESRFGEFYELAVELYNYEKEEAYLENYAVDVLNLYAPVDGVEIQCSPKIWRTREIVDELKVGLEENFRTIKFKGEHYVPKDDREYFVLDKEVSESVNVMYLKDWPTKIEINGENVGDEVIVAEPVGTQEGLGVMGFCYVPYHYVYDVSFPALIQIYNVEELFQFPVAVIIDNNLPREAVLSESFFEEEEEYNICEFLTQDVKIELRDVNLNAVDANVSYECFSQRCRVGQSVNGIFEGKIPACVNGYLSFDAGGYEAKRELFSSNDENYLDIVLDREHEVVVVLEVGGKELDGNAIVSFKKIEGKTKTIALPQQESVKLSEGNYEIKVYVYGNSSIVIPANTRRECVDVLREGLLGFLGGTKEECFDIEIPETKIEYAWSGGGVINSYLLESELEKGVMNLRVESLPKPNSMEELAGNFELFDTRGGFVIFDET